MSKANSERFDINSISHLDVTGKIEYNREEKIGFGGYSDVSRGTMDNGSERIPVAIKELRVRAHPGNTSLEVRLRKRFLREVVLWNKLHHPNIVPLLGFTITSNSTPTLVSPLYVNGNVVEYLKKNPKANRPHLLLDVANGIHYLHSLPLVHGDIKGDNVLVNGDGIASLCDFGMAKFIDDALHITGLTTTGLGGGGTPRCLCPELLDDKPRTKMSDIWAFGCTAIQIMTDQAPYADVVSSHAVPKYVIQGRSPLAPGYTPQGRKESELWGKLRKCWEMDPSERPDIVAIGTSIRDIFFKTTQFPAVQVDVDVACEWQMIEAELHELEPNGLLAPPQPARHSHRKSISGRTASMLSRRLTQLRSLLPRAATDPGCSSNPISGHVIHGSEPEVEAIQDGSTELDQDMQHAHQPDIPVSRDTNRRRSRHRHTMDSVPIVVVEEPIIEDLSRTITLERLNESANDHSTSLEKTRAIAWNNVTINSFSNTSEDGSCVSFIPASAPVEEGDTDTASLTNGTSIQSISGSQGVLEDRESLISSRQISGYELIQEIVASEESYVNRLIQFQNSFVGPLLHWQSSKVNAESRHGTKNASTSSHFMPNSSNESHKTRQKDRRSMSVEHTVVFPTIQNTMLADPQSTSCTLDALSNDPAAPELEYHEKIPMKSSQSSEGLQKCLRILERQLLMGHGTLSRDLKYRSYQKNPSITDVIRCFLDNWSLFEAYVEYVQHLEIALRQVNGALNMEPSNQPSSMDTLDKKIIDQIRQLERLALQRSHAGFSTSLLLPFERLLEYSAMFQGLLLHMDLSKVEPNSDTLQLALKLECIFRDIDKSGLKTIDRVNVPSLWPNGVRTINLEDGKPKPRLLPRPPDPRAFSITATVGTAPPSPTFAIRNDRDDHPFNTTDRSVRTWEYRDETDSIDTDRKAVTELSRQHGFIRVRSIFGVD